MAKTYTQITRQIESLQQQADALKRKESGGVIARIKEAIAFYGLTALDLGLAAGGQGSKGAPAKAADSSTGAAGKRASAGRKRATKRPSMVRFRDGEGHSWTGMGRKPGWLVAGLDAGKTLADFAVGPPKDDGGSPD